MVAVLVSLPLRSPNDALCNTLTVAIESLFIGVAAGVLWVVLSRGRSPHQRFLLLWAGALAVVIGLAFAVDIEVDRAASFGAPLAVIMFGLTGATMLLHARLPPLASWRVAVVGVLVALALGGSLITQGDQESGELSLPPRAASMADAPSDPL